MDNVEWVRPDPPQKGDEETYSPKAGELWMLSTLEDPKRYAVWEVLETPEDPKTTPSRMIESTWNGSRSTFKPGATSDCNMHPRTVRDTYWRKVRDVPTNICANCDGEAALDDYLCSTCRRNDG